MKFIWRFSETIPLISFNHSIDFVQRFHWIRSTIPLDLSRLSVAFVLTIRQFRRSFLAVLSGSAGKRKGQKPCIRRPLPFLYSCCCGSFLIQISGVREFRSSGVQKLQTILLVRFCMLSK